jgi:hypothetical protein
MDGRVVVQVDRASLLGMFCSVLEGLENRLAMTHMSHAFQRSSSQFRQQFAMIFHVSRNARRGPETARVALVERTGE